MVYELSAHVKREMVRRNITEEIIELILKRPDQKVPEHGNVVCYQSKMELDHKSYLVRVMVNESLIPVKVVTVYRTSKIDKYWKVSL